MKGADAVGFGTAGHCLVRRGFVVGPLTQLEHVVEVLDDASSYEDAFDAAAGLEQASTAVGVLQGCDPLCRRHVGDFLPSGVAHERVERALESQQDAYGSDRALSGDLQAVCAGGLDPLQEILVEVR